MATKISKEEFFILHELILDRHAELCPIENKPKNNTSALYGFYDFDPEGSPSDNFSIKGLMLANSDIKAYLEKNSYKISGRYLYDVKQKFKEVGKNFHILKAPYEFIYFKFIGCTKGYSQFKEEIYPVEKELRWKKFTGYYFSEADRQVKTFQLDILESKVENFYPTVENGLHKTSDEKYHGYAVKRNIYLFIDLENQKNHKLSFIGLIGETKIWDIDIFSASFHSVSGLKLRPFAGECIITRSSPALKENTINEIHLYLVLRRNHFWTDQIFQSQDVSKLINRHDDNYFNLQGKTFRIWNFSLKEGHIMQSRFEIKSNFQSFLESPVKLVNKKKIKKIKQTCLLFKSNIGGVKLCVLSFKEGGDSIMNYAIIDITNPDKNGIYEGVFTTVGIKPTTGVIASYIVLVEEEGQFDVCEMDFYQVKSLAKTPIYKNLINKLLNSLSKMEKSSNRVIEKWTDMLEN